MKQEIIKDMIYYRKAIENIIEEARRNHIDVLLEKNILGDLDVMIVDKNTEERCRVRRLQLSL